MAARESAAVLAALADVQAGKSRAEAAARHSVDPSSISRAMRRKGLDRLPSGRPRKTLAPLPEPFRFADGTPLVTA